MGIKTGILAVVLGLAGYIFTIKGNADSIKDLNSIPQVKRYYKLMDKFDSLNTVRPTSNTDLQSLVNQYRETQQERLFLTYQKSFDSLKTVYDSIEKNQFDHNLFLFSLVSLAGGGIYLTYLHGVAHSSHKKNN